MKITKYGHCCLLIETNEKRILTDPGAFSTGFTMLTEIDIVLITHEHGDHLHIESLKAVLETNPHATVITNESVGKLLQKEQIECTIVADQEQLTPHSIPLKAYEGEHVEIFAEYGLVQNTGFLINDSLFYPGDAYTVPAEAVSILALPVAGPWCKLSAAIRYALQVKPRMAFPVHDAVLSEAGKQATYPHCSRELEAAGITFETFAEKSTIDI